MEPAGDGLWEVHTPLRVIVVESGRRMTAAFPDAELFTAPGRRDRRREAYAFL